MDVSEKIEAWTVDSTATLLAATSISSPSGPARQTRGASVTLAIPLDDDDNVRRAARDSDAAATAGLRSTPAMHTVYKRREPIRRDSLKRREALLKGKEGSRQRRRWENDRLVGNPHAEPPLPEDWQAQPTYPVRRVSYVLAPLWDAEYARAAHERRQREARRDAAALPRDPDDVAAERVLQELRAKLKRARGARGLLQGLEQEVRGFVEQWEAKARQLEREGLIEPSDSEDDEIVFVGRGGVMDDDRSRSSAKLAKDKLIFESLSEDHGAAFGRYLVHSIAEYYGLATWSRTLGNRREAYIGLKTDPKTRRPSLTRAHMPQPLWTVV